MTMTNLWSWKDRSLSCGVEGQESGVAAGVQAWKIPYAEGAAKKKKKRENQKIKEQYCIS